MTTIQTFDFSADILRALLWRHNEAANLTALLQDKQDFFTADNTQFWTDWIADVFDLRTANEFGLNVWALILGLNITIDPFLPPANSSFGFGANRKNFENGNFSAAASSTALTVEEARLVLRLRFYQLVLNGNVLDINLALEDIFGDQGLVFIQDINNMTIIYAFDIPVSATLEALLIDFDILPRPTGVSVTIFIIP